MNEIVDQLLIRGARPYVRNDVGYNALMIASEEGQAHIVEALLRFGASRTLRNRKRETAIDLALMSKHAEIAQLLKQ